MVTAPMSALNLGQMLMQIRLLNLWCEFHKRLITLQEMPS